MYARKTSTAASVAPIMAQITAHSHQPDVTMWPADLFLIDLSSDIFNSRLSLSCRKGFLQDDNIHATSPPDEQDKGRVKCPPLSHINLACLPSSSSSLLPSYHWRRCVTSPSPDSAAKTNGRLYLRGTDGGREGGSAGERGVGKSASASGIGIGKATELARAAARVPSLVPIRKTIYPECSHLDV